MHTKLLIRSAKTTCIYPQEIQLCSVGTLSFFHLYFRYLEAANDLRTFLVSIFDLLTYFNKKERKRSIFQKIMQLNLSKPQIFVAMYIVTWLLLLPL